MLERLSLNDIIRYFLIGTLTTILTIWALGVSFNDIIFFLLSDDDNISFDVLATTIFISLILLIGYFVFTLYRTILYGLFIMAVKCILEHWIPIPTPRRWLRTQCLKESLWSLYWSENLHGIIRQSKGIKEYYEDRGEAVITGLHFFYCSSILLIILSAVRFSCIGLSIGVVLFTLTLVANYAFDQFQTLLLQIKSECISKFIAPLIRQTSGENKAV